MLIMPLDISGDKVLKPRDYTAYWLGERPRNIDRSLVLSLVNDDLLRNHGDGLKSEHYLSCKPDNYADKNYPTFYEKVVTYYNTISSPAFATDKQACERLKNEVVQQSEDSVLLYAETNATRADIASLSDCFKEQKVAIIGLGGTGAYLLDFLAKMPLKEIHLFDDDLFNTHNAYRCPGVASTSILSECMMKVTYLKNIYSNMHKAIFEHPVKVTSSNIAELDEMDFVFICVDTVDARNNIARHLIEKTIPFIDSGLGLIKGPRGLMGLIRVTTGYPEHYNHVGDAFGCEVGIEDEYSSNIQIAELNALAAILMVTKWKRMMNYYVDEGNADNNIVYSIPVNEIAK